MIRIIASEGALARLIGVPVEQPFTALARAISVGETSLKEFMSR